MRVKDIPEDRVTGPLVSRALPGGRSGSPLGGGMRGVLQKRGDAGEP